MTTSKTEEFIVRDAENAVWKCKRLNNKILRECIKNCKGIYYSLMSVDYFHKLIMEGRFVIEGTYKSFGHKQEGGYDW